MGPATQDSLGDQSVSPGLLDPDRAHWGRCPECNDKMVYEDDRDDETGEILNAWVECPSCGHCEGLRESDL